jgi:two-component system, chemotaxis family, chemotaxis protein CheY
MLVERRVRVLIVDDSPVARRILRHHLVKFGCTILGEAETAAQAVQMFRELNPDLITLDVMMPPVDDFDAMAAFNVFRREAPATSILVVSAVPYDKVRETFLRAGALDYIVKPFNQYSFESVRRKLVRTFGEVTA